MQWQEQEVFSRFDRLAASIATANEDYTEEEVQADVAEALAAVRKQA
ncbi:MAG: hypothetical protein IPK53_09785 [bacterium]|nr:hypothetical protein [bacterium]